MRRLYRDPISSRSDRFLQRRTCDVLASPTPAARARELWKRRKNKAFDEIRAALRAMAPGLERCMYCEDSMGTDIDHFRPKAMYPEHAFDWANYLLACSHCNSNEKRDQFPLDAAGAPLLINPVDEDPLPHFVFSPTTGKLIPATPRGTASSKTYGLDRELLARGRLNAWIVMQALIVRYGAMRQRGDDAAAENVKRTLREHPFSSVMVWLVRLMNGPGAQLVDATVQAIAHAYPEVTYVGTGLTE